MAKFKFEEWDPWCDPDVCKNCDSCKHVDNDCRNEPCASCDIKPEHPSNWEHPNA